MQQVKICGLGGQGAVTASKILAEAVSIEEMRYAVTVPAYGHERRGAPVFADVMIDDEPIELRSFVYEPDYVLVFDPTVRDKGLDYMKGTDENTVFVVNISNCEVPEHLKDRKLIFADATLTALEVINRDVPNSAMLGLFARTGAVRIDSIVGALNKVFSGDGGKNARAAALCFERGMQRNA